MTLEKEAGVTVGKGCAGTRQCETLEWGKSPGESSTWGVALRDLCFEKIALVSL